MNSIRWGWILLGAILTEVAIFAVVIPFAVLAGEESLTYVAPVASFVASFACGLWVASKASRQRVLHGTAVGLIATAITFAMTLDVSIPYLVAHALKVLGGVAGGFIAFKRSSASAASEVRPV